MAPTKRSFNHQFVSFITPTKDHTKRPPNYQLPSILLHQRKDLLIINSYQFYYTNEKTIKSSTRINFIAPPKRPPNHQLVLILLHQGKCHLILKPYQFSCTSKKTIKSSTFINLTNKRSLINSYQFYHSKENTKNH